jgi:tRNA (guanine37-N1)-methyltransferase
VSLKVLPVRIDIISVFPEYLTALSLSLLGKARKDNDVNLKINVHNLRDWAEGTHRQVDDTPYGGGPGMVMSPDVWGRALDAIQADSTFDPLLVIPTPSGGIFSHSIAQEWSAYEHLVFACGRYEGIDSRVSQFYANAPGWQGVSEVSIGDYVLAGGEAAVLVMVESIVRLLPGVLGNPLSASDDSFARSDGMVEGAVFTKPPVWRGISVPEELLSGNHAAIAEWRSRDAHRRTQEYRPDLLS